MMKDSLCGGERMDEVRALRLAAQKEERLRRERDVQEAMRDEVARLRREVERLTAERREMNEDVTT